MLRKVPGTRLPVECILSISSSATPNIPARSFTLLEILGEETGMGTGPVLTEPSEPGGLQDVTLGAFRRHVARRGENGDV
ncbi:hypothetical protein SKAU_G00272840 [Synaphobranchus kaupii]|uniref:Uncharacterized protein n=1 Tax=Synaphobranchus kaupii TaxID=118154 RepID=A0A9Q1F0U4_SYNKA|nr:hypothetical protein SKAU_G00272840 [Synaphobranchus kaupii]